MIDIINFTKLMIDTAPFIYFIEEHEKYFPVIKPIFDKVDLREIEAVTSTITLIEVLVQPVKHQNEDLEDKYLKILTNNANLELISIGSSVAQKAARIRAQYEIKTPDAAQLACGILNGCDGFLTHDKALKKVKEILIITFDDLLTKNEA